MGLSLTDFLWLQAGFGAAIGKISELSKAEVAIFVKNDECIIENDGLFIKNDGFCIKNDEYNANAQENALADAAQRAGVLKCAFRPPFRFLVAPF